MCLLVFHNYLPQILKLKPNTNILSHILMVKIPDMCYLSPLLQFHQDETKYDWDSVKTTISWRSSDFL